jgi:hypothetical protein
MSRELLEECKQAILANLQKWQYKDEVALYNVLQKIETELSKPEPEPVAWIFKKGLDMLNLRGTFTSTTIFAKQDESLVPLYTSPPTRKHMSDDEIMQVIDGALHLVKKLA